MIANRLRPFFDSSMQSTAVNVLFNYCLSWQPSIFPVSFSLEIPSLNCCWSFYTTLWKVKNLYQFTTVSGWWKPMECKNPIGKTAGKKRDDAVHSFNAFFKLPSLWTVLKNGALVESLSYAIISPGILALFQSRNPGVNAKQGYCISRTFLWSIKILLAFWNSRSQEEEGQCSLEDATVSDFCNASLKIWREQQRRGHWTRPRLQTIRTLKNRNSRNCSKTVSIDLLDIKFYSLD